MYAPTDHFLYFNRKLEKKFKKELSGVFETYEFSECERIQTIMDSTINITSEVYSTKDHEVDHQFKYSDDIQAISGATVRGRGLTQGINRLNVIMDEI